MYRRHYTTVRTATLCCRPLLANYSKKTRKLPGTLRYDTERFNVCAPQWSTAVPEPVIQ